MDKPTRTSYSALTTYEECPLAYKLGYIDKISTPSGAAADRGTRLHLACERFLLGEIDSPKLPIDFYAIKQFLIEAKEHGAKAEEVWLIDNEWNLQPEEDNTTRFKAVVDIHYVEGDVLHIWDLKTGKSYPEHADQLEAYAVIGFSAYTGINSVQVKALYLDQFGHHAVYQRALATYLRKKWQERWSKLFVEKEWSPTPGPNACRWCHYAKMGYCDSPWARK